MDFKIYQKNVKVNLRTHTHCKIYFRSTKETNQPLRKIHNSRMYLIN